MGELPDYNTKKVGAEPSESRMRTEKIPAQPKVVEEKVTSEPEKVGAEPEKLPVRRKKTAQIQRKWG